jgi:hypothetical protein
MSHQSRDKSHRSMCQVRVNFASPVWQLASPAGPLPADCLSHVSPTLAISIRLQYTAQFRDSIRQAEYRTCLRLPRTPEIKLIHISHQFSWQQTSQNRMKSTGHTTQFHTNIMNPGQVSQYSDLGYALDGSGFVPGWGIRFLSSPGNQTSSGTTVFSHTNRVQGVRSLDGPPFVPSLGNRFLSSPGNQTSSVTLVFSHTNWVQGVCSPGAKWLEYEDNHPLPSSAKVTEGWYSMFTSL